MSAIRIIEYWEQKETMKHGRLSFDTNNFCSKFNKFNKFYKFSLVLYIDYCILKNICTKIIIVYLIVAIK